MELTFVIGFWLFIILGGLKFLTFTLAPYDRAYKAAAKAKAEAETRKDFWEDA